MLALLVFKITYVKLKQLFDLCKDHVKNLRVRHLISSVKSEEKIPLTTILQSLPLLNELCICFKQVNENVLKIFDLVYNISKLLSNCACLRSEV